MDAWYDWAVDLDLSSDAAPAIRYRLGGASLARNGEAWIPLGFAPGRVTGVSFSGDGAIGDFKGVYAGRVAGEPVVPVFGGERPLGFGVDSATGAPTFSTTIVNAVAGCHYTAFVGSALDEDFVAAKDSEQALADGTVVLVVDAVPTVRFVRVVASTFPIEAGTAFSSLRLDP